jgi:hypothetical protein
MLKNENLKQINNTITLLTTIKLYLLENDVEDFIDKTGIDLVDIQHSIKDLIAIHTQETLKHKQASEKANAWNKAHPEEHRRHSREAHRRHPRKEYQHQYYLKRKAQQ